MKDLNRHIRDSQIAPFIQELYLNHSAKLLTRENGTLDYYDLDIDDKFKLQGLIMLALPVRHQFEYITERGKEEIPHFLAMYLKTGEKEHLEKMELALVQSAVLYNVELVNQLLSHYKKEFYNDQSQND